MPFYEYECSACKYYVEALQKISDPPMIKCPSCGKQTLQRLLSVPVFRLKGSGWYETDFKSDKEQKRNIAGEPEAAPEKDKKDSEESSEPTVRARKKSAVTTKTVPASGNSTVHSTGKKSAARTAKRAAPKSPKKPVKRNKGAAGVAKAKKPAKKPVKKTSAKKNPAKKKSVKKLSKRRPIAKKK